MKNDLMISLLPDVVHRPDKKLSAITFLKVRTAHEQVIHFSPLAADGPYALIVFDEDKNIRLHNELSAAVREPLVRLIVQRNAHRIERPVIFILVYVLILLENFPGKRNAFYA